MNAIRNFFDFNIGRCPRCMKIAFASALGAWAIYLAARTVWPEIPILALALPLVLSALWLAHVAAYSGRVIALLCTEYRPVSASTSRNSAEASELSRRSLLSVMVLAAGVIATGTIWFPGRASAAGSPCGEGHTCPDDAPNCCSRSLHKCCNGNWACSTTGKCFTSHSDARAACGSGEVWACS